MVHRVPHVTIVVTGTELRPPGERAGPGQIYESNGVMLAAVMEAAGAAVTRLAATEDTEDAHAASLEEALEADVVVTSGGVSVGPHDLVRRVQARLGVEEVFWGVAMRPGQAACLWLSGDDARLRLAGQPRLGPRRSLLFVRPALLALTGHPDPAPPFRPGTLAAAIPQRPERDDFVRARVTWGDDGALVEPIVGQESHMIAHTTAATGLAWIPRGRARSTPVHAFAFCLSEARRTPRARRSSRHRRARSARRESAELRGDRRPRDQDEHGRPGDEAERHQRNDVQRRVEAELELGPDGDERERRARRARCRRGSRAASRRSTWEARATRRAKESTKSNA